MSCFCSHIRDLYILSQIAPQDIWEKDLGDSLNARVWQHIWGNIYKAAQGIRVQQIQVNILHRTCCSLSTFYGVGLQTDATCWKYRKFIGVFLNCIELS